MKKTIPAISIVIPMYNTEKYIGDCLDSIFAQTFEDYEVIVVDDCSTDNSCTIVENYITTHRGGVDKLRLIRSEKNSNTPGMPRNVGIRFSRGEYILFVDSDDGLTPTALEELYPIAKNFDADVLYCEKCYSIKIGEKFTTNKDFLQEEVLGNINYDLVNKPTLVSVDMAERIKDFLKLKFYVVPWNYLIRRDLISKHDIHFPNIKYGEDNFFAMYLVCLAKNLVRVPNIVYVNRTREGSIRTNTSVEIEIRRFTDHVFQGVSIVNEFAEKFSFLKEHPEFRYALLNFLAATHFNNVAPLYVQIPAWQLEPLVMRELNKIEDKTALTAFLFARMALLNLNVNQQGAIMQQMNAVIQQQNQALQQQQAKINELQQRLESSL